jgi:hypothetical protein
VKENERAMSRITDALQKEIEGSDPALYFKEPICMIRVSKDWKGEFRVADSADEKCLDPHCTTIKGLIKFESKVQRHQPCDAVASGSLDGDIRGLLAFNYIDDGQRRGYHVGKLEWAGGASKLIGQMTGTTNAGTHRSPVVQCERCEEPGHMEGCLEAVVIEGQSEGCRLVATYAIEFDPAVAPQNTGCRGTLEGVLICDCKH